MAFDLNALLQDPQFQTGMGLMGVASSRNAPMLQAFQMLQAMEQNKRKAEQQKIENEYKKAQAERAQEQMRLYGMQVKAQQAGVDQQAEIMKMAREDLMGGQQVNQPAQMSTQPPTPATPSVAAPPIVPPTSDTFSFIDPFVSKIEGGYVANDGGKGPTNYGINQRANPDINVKTLTPALASQVRKQRYWDALSLDRQPPATAAVAYDAAINQGQSYALELLEKTGGVPELMIQQRREDYRKLAKSNLTHAANLKGWEKRLDDLQEHLKVQAQPAPVLPAKPKGRFEREYEFGDGKAKIKLKERKPEVYKPGDYVDGRQMPDPLGERRLAGEEAERASRISEREQGMTEKQGKAYQAHQSLNMSLSQMFDTAKSLKEHKGLASITGLSSYVPAELQGPDARNARGVMEHLKGQIFVNASQAFRRANETGGSVGQQSDWEGKQFVDAWAQLNQAQTTDEFKNALDKLMVNLTESQVRMKATYDYYHGKRKGEVSPENFKRIVRVGKRNGKRVVQFEDGEIADVE